MGLRFRKSINLGGGLKLNFNKKSAGLSFGTKVLDLVLIVMEEKLLVLVFPVLVYIGLSLEKVN